MSWLKQAAPETLLKFCARMKIIIMIKYTLLVGSTIASFHFLLLTLDLRVYTYEFKI